MRRGELVSRMKAPKDKHNLPLSWYKPPYNKKSSDLDSIISLITGSWAFGYSTLMHCEYPYSVPLLSDNTLNYPFLNELDDDLPDDQCFTPDVYCHLPHNWCTEPKVNKYFGLEYPDELRYTCGFGLYNNPYDNYRPCTLSDGT